MVLSKFDLVAIALVAGGLLVLEYKSQVTIKAPEAAVRSTAACPANESVPFSMECMAFIQGNLSTPALMPVDTTAASPELP
jgi:hypothetical protein